MPDKFQDTFPIEVIFVAGEQPTATKLSAWSNQTNTGLNKVEKALGDLRSTGFPLFSNAPQATPTGTWAYQKDGTVIGGSPETTHLQILQLARLIGPASALNPRMLGLAERGGSNATLTSEILAQDTDFYLQHKPTGAVDFTGASNCTFLKGNWKDVVDPGDYWIHSSSGRVVCQTPGDGVSDVVTYAVDPTATNQLDTYHGANANVIPHPNQQPKCDVTTAGDGYQITFPGVGDQQANWDETSTHLEGAVPGFSPDNFNYNAQYTFPGWLTSKYTTTDELIAEGLLGLWDEEDNLFVSCTFHVPNPPWPGNQNEVRVQSCTLDHTVNNRYSIIVAGGTDITRTLDTLRTKFRHHTHSGNDGDQRLNHGSLAGTQEGSIHTHHSDGVNNQPYNFVAHNDGSLINWADEPNWSTSPPNADTMYFVTAPSPFYDHHPQYLGRWGRDGSHSRNAMLGHLLLGTNHLLVGQGASPIPVGSRQPPIFNSTYSSFGIQFSSEHGPMIYFCNNSSSSPVVTEGISRDDSLRLRGSNVYIDEGVQINKNLFINNVGTSLASGPDNIINGNTHIDKLDGYAGRARLYCNTLVHETDIHPSSTVPKAVQVLFDSNFQIEGCSPLQRLGGVGSPFNQDLGGVLVVGSGGATPDHPARLEIDTPASSELNVTNDTGAAGTWLPMGQEQARSVYTNTVIAAKCVFSGGSSGFWESGDPILGSPALEAHSHNIASVTREVLGIASAGTYRVTYQTPVHADAAVLVSFQSGQGGAQMSCHIHQQTSTYVIIEVRGTYIPGGVIYGHVDADKVNLIVVGAVAS